MKRVVVTGMGIWSCIGRNKEEVTASLRAGRSGISYDEARKEYGFRSPLTGMVETPDLKALLHRRLRTGMSQEEDGQQKDEYRQWNIELKGEYYEINRQISYGILRCRNGI